MVEAALFYIVVESSGLSFPAEFHSDDSNKKDTAIISATNDPIRALKKVFQKWRGGDFKTRNASTIFVSVIYTSKYYVAQDMTDFALAVSADMETVTAGSKAALRSIEVIADDILPKLEYVSLFLISRKAIG
jgi:hypothetical protein